MKTLDDVLAAYSSRDDEGLYKSLRKFHRHLIGLVYSLGPAVTAITIQQLLGHTSITGILNKLGATSDEDTVGERLAFQAGAVSTYLDYFRLIALEHKVDEADARLSNLPDQEVQTNLVRITILKTTFCNGGERPKRLIDSVARYAKVKNTLVKTCLQELLELKLVERVTWARRIISYRITGLGEGIVMRRSHAYDIALFQIDMAASDPQMRAAMRDEIRRTWPPEG